MKALALAGSLLGVCLVPYGLSAQSVPASAAPWVQTKSGLSYQVVTPGKGLTAAPGDRITIHETLSLPDGKMIFSTRAKNQPVTFTLGAAQVIPGVDEGVSGMRVGERRKLLVPPSLDGRTFDRSFIPADAVRHYDIEVLAIER